MVNRPSSSELPFEVLAEVRLTFPSPEGSIERRADSQGGRGDPDQLSECHVRVISENVKEDTGEGEIAEEDEHGISCASTGEQVT